MSVEHEKPVRVAVIGMEQRSQAALEMVFKGPGKGAYIIADEDSAEVTLVDLDGMSAPELWSAHRTRFPSRPAILLSVSGQPREGSVCLRKPVKVSDFLQALRESAEIVDSTIGARLSHATVAEAMPTSLAEEGIAQVPDNVPRKPARPASTRRATLALERATTPGYEATVATGSPIDMTDPEQLEKLFYSTEEYVGGQMLKVLEASLRDGIAREIRCWNGRIVILPAARRVFTDLPDMRLKQISIVGFNVREVQAGVAPFEFRVTELTETSDVWVLERELSATMSSEIPEGFTWKVTAWISRGRVPSDTNLTAPVVLIHWPNLTRLLMIPNAMRIAALWAEQPRSLINSARALKIPLSQVLTFYSAAKAIGLIMPPKWQVDFLFHPEPVAEHESRSLFKGILGELLGTGST